MLNLFWTGVIGALGMYSLVHGECGAVAGLRAAAASLLGTTRTRASQPQPGPACPARRPTLPIRRLLVAAQSRSV